MDGYVKPVPHFYLIDVSLAIDSHLSNTIENYFSIFKRAGRGFIVYTWKPSAVTKFILFETDFVSRNRIQISEYFFNVKEKRNQNAKRHTNLAR